VLPLLAVVACSGGQKGDRDNRGDFKVAAISTGSGAIFPYRIREVDTFGNPTQNITNIDSDAKLQDNVSAGNGVLPVATFPTVAELPNGAPGNHFLHFTFTHKLDVESILSDSLAGQSNSGLTGALSLVLYDPSTESTTPLKGQGFVDGYTYYNVAGVMQRVRAVEPNGTGVRILDSRANGFPNYPGAADLVTNKSFVFVADNDLSNSTLQATAPFDMFPSTGLIRITVTSAVRDTENDVLEQEIATATTVGADPNPPQVLGFTSLPQISPGNGETGVDPTSTILVRFNKPVQPHDVGSFFDPQVLTPPSGGVTLSITAAGETFTVIYHADPINYGDMMNYIVTPAYSLPGNATVTVQIQSTVVHDLGGTLLGQTIATNFDTGTGPGLVNAPVAPEAIYVGIGGERPGVAVIDLNGFGQGTGDPTRTRFPLNPNIGRNGVIPPMAEVIEPGETLPEPLYAGSGGTLTLTLDTNLQPRLLRDPIVGDVTDIHIGAPLDLVFNNENINDNATRANQVNELLGLAMPGNVITQPPVPNPPRLRFPPPNPGRSIFGEEPTVKTSTGLPTQLVTGGPPVGCATSAANRLGVGNPFSNDPSQVGVYGSRFMGTFVGPQLPPTSPPPPTPFCPFTSRQQIGHFLYVLDRENRQILVVNSNRFTVLDSIQLSDPVDMAMAPNMNRLAVTNFASASVSFIDINPLSATFHQVVGETRVERGPTAIAWQPDGEDVLVVSTESNFLSVLTASDFSVRRSLAGFLNAPIDIIVTERYLGTGIASGVYYAYVLNSNGTVAIYESGPDGVNGIGFNDMIGTIPNNVFPRASRLAHDTTSNQGGLLVAHVDDQGLGQVSRLEISAALPGPSPINPNAVTVNTTLPPTYRQKEWRVTQRYGGLAGSTPVRDLMSGNSIIDIAVDDMYNNGGLYGQGTQFNGNAAITAFDHSGKHTIKPVPGGFVPATVPKLLFVALSDVGKVDVFDINSTQRIATLDVPGVRVVASYWRQ
jgi:hypothetical protein